MSSALWDFRGPNTGTAWSTLSVDTWRPSSHQFGRCADFHDAREAPCEARTTEASSFVSAVFVRLCTCCNASSSFATEAIASVFQLGVPGIWCEMMLNDQTWREARGLFEILNIETSFP